MYPTFEDKEAAIQDLYGQAGELLSKIEAKYGIGTLCSDNWKEYYEDALEYIYNEENGLLDWDTEPQAILIFFDIYENDANNQEIIDHYDPLIKNVDNEFYTLPYDRENIGIKEPEVDPSIWSLSMPKIYLNNYTVNPDYSGYGVFKYVYVNFTSQIKFVDGKIQE